MIRKMYSCEIDDCNWTGMVRSTVKNRESRHYGKKVCPIHAKEYNEYKDTRTPLKQGVWKYPQKAIKKITEKTKARKKKQSEIRNEYFNYHLGKATHSEESGRSIQATRANICHIFPKRFYKSIQADTDNCVYLSIDEHTRFDYLLDTIDLQRLEEEFTCWPAVIERVKVLLPRITENGKLKVALEEYIEKN